jgi:hypothetical protein
VVNAWRLPTLQLIHSSVYCVDLSIHPIINSFTMVRLLPRALQMAAASLALVSAVSAGALGIKNGKITITSPDGLSDATYT